MNRILIVIFAVLLLTGCTQEQVNRAQVAADHAQDYLAKVEAAEKKATEALALADSLATQLGSEKAKEAVDKARATMQVIEDARAAAQLAVTTTQATVAAAKSSQAAGESTFNVLLAAIGAFVPGAGAAVLAIQSATKSARALRQTVSGITDVREAIGASDWACKVAPLLSAAQDESVKSHIAKIKASI